MKLSVSFFPTSSYDVLSYFPQHPDLKHPHSNNFFLQSERQKPSFIPELN